jgi:hypothetical protein
MCAMYLLIRPRRDPALTIRERSGLVSNEAADTTHREQRRCDEGFSHRIGRRLTSCLSEQILKNHTSPLSFSIYLRDREQQRGNGLSLIDAGLVIQIDSRLWNWEAPQFYGNKLLASQTIRIEKTMPARLKFDSSHTPYNERTLGRIAITWCA